MRTSRSADWRSSWAAGFWPSGWTQVILASTWLRRWWPLQRRHAQQDAYGAALLRANAASA